MELIELRVGFRLSLFQDGVGESVDPSKVPCTKRMLRLPIRDILSRIYYSILTLAYFFTKAKD